jgi:uncharacterized membrane protein YoaK (UPF0700 family)
MRINRLVFTSIMLSFVAGYADTSTFVGADGLFSAHVTGNFVIFAYDIITNQLAGSWLKLIAFPVFIVAVFFTTLIIDYTHNDRRAINLLFVMEGFLLTIAGLVSWFYGQEKTVSIVKDLIPMMVVFALGLQNAYGRIFAKELLAPTTVMTGNVTQFIIDLAGFLKNKDHKYQDFKLKLVQGLYVILPFLMGCIGGTLMTKAVGLGSMVFIGLLMFLLVLFSEDLTTRSAVITAH